LTREFSFAEASSCGFSRFSSQTLSISLMFLKQELILFYEFSENSI